MTRFYTGHFEQIYRGGFENDALKIERRKSMKKTTITLTENELTNIINALTYKADRIADTEKAQELENLESWLRAVRKELRED